MQNQRLKWGSGAEEGLIVKKPRYLDVTVHALPPGIRTTLCSKNFCLTLGVLEFNFKGSRVARNLRKNVYHRLPHVQIECLT